MKSDELRVTMKESPGRYINPFLSDEENEQVNFWNNPELEHSTIEHDFTTNPEDEKFRKSLAPCNVPSESLEKAKELYIDKNITESQLPELMACYEESGFHVVKDICVDEGLSNEFSCNPVTINGDKHDDMIKDNLGTQFSSHEQLISSPLQDCSKNTDLFQEIPDTHFPMAKDGNDHINIGFNHDDMIGGNLNTQFQNHEKIISSSDSSQGKDREQDASEDDTRPSNCASDDLKLFVESIIVKNTENCSPDNLTSIKVLESPNDVDQQLSEVHSPVEEILKRRLTGSEGRTGQSAMEENSTLNFDNVKPETASGPHGPDHPDCIHEPDPQSALNHQDTAPTVVNQLHHGGGESSFSVLGPVSGLITYSGPITASGSISHRSDSSNTSIRSFAFPILQTEWNSSPVRMAKVDQRRTRKNRGWRDAIMCCKF